MKRLFKIGCLGFLGLIALAVIMSIVSPPRQSSRTETPPQFSTSNTERVQSVASGAQSQATSEEPRNAVVPAAAAPTVPPSTGPSFSEICDASERNLTEVQLQAHADSFIGQEFTNWPGYVYDVRRESGDYVVLVAMERRGFLWNRDLEIHGVPDDIAEPLRVEQPVLVSGVVQSVDTTLGALCNPLVIQDGVLNPSETGGDPLPVPSSGEIAFSDICGIDTGKVTAAQLESFANSFDGREFSNWRAYVYDVQSRSGRYELQLAMEPRGLLVWARDIVVDDIPAELASQLNVEQPVLLSGRIDHVEIAFGTICNPIVVSSATVVAEK